MSQLTANELRIGNYVQEEILRNVDHKILWEISEFCYSYRPISITEEWLLRLGFDFNVDYLLTKNGFYICFEKSSGLLKCFVNSCEINIKYVHQLQNLYFALTNEELKIND